MSDHLYPSYDEQLSWRLGYDSILQFGKHKGKSVEEVLDIDPDYIKWIKDKGIHKCRPEINQALKEIYELRATKK